ncbi:hypothetical protein COU76_04870, partial [Candidatus Peregrinibacteria bacterium CG10_big_fil_rev_8_21_14_0_10_49_10]
MIVECRSAKSYHTSTPFLPYCIFKKYSVVRHISLPVLLGMVMLVLPGEALTLQLQSNRYQPNDFKDVEAAIGDIEADLENAQCGGWLWNQSILPSINDPDSKGLIPQVSGVPGHPIQDVLGQIESGMAERANEFEYPDDTQGFTTACRPGFPGFYEIFLPCQRPAGAGTIEGFDGPKIFKSPSRGPQFTDNAVQSDPESDSVLWTCDALCEDLNRRWIWDQYFETCTNQYTDENGNVHTDYNEFTHPFTGCYDRDTQEPQPKPNNVFSQCNVRHSMQKREMYCCTNMPRTHFREVTNGEGNTNETTDVIEVNTNCKPCTGEECSRKMPNEGWQDRPYISYYRRYKGSCERDALESAAPEDDHERTDIPVSCYGEYVMQFGEKEYGEYDPKEKVTQWWQHRCVIANTYGEEQSFAKMPETQLVDMSLGNVEYGQKNYKENTDDEDATENDPLVWLDPPSNAYKIVRQFPDEENTEEERTFDSAKDLWYPEISGGFSLLNRDVWKNTYGSNFTYALLSPDMTKMKSYPQLTEAQPYSSGAYIRAFEDSVYEDANGDIRRPIAEWWQELETEAYKLFSPPQVRLLLPPIWTVGLDPLDPFFSPKFPDAQNPPEDKDPRTEPLEVQLKVQEDLLGEVAAYMERSLLIHLQEEAVPLVVPLGNPTEYRAKAHAWCTWFMQKEEVLECESAPGEIGNLIRGLESYADQLDAYRALRGELAQYQASLLERQEKMISAIGKWLQTNAQDYQDFQESVDQLANLQGLWKGAQFLYRDFHDKTNMPWCMNQRFTLPIYSLLDNWFPGRPTRLPEGCDDGSQDPNQHCIETAPLDGCLDKEKTTTDPNCFPRFTVNVPADVVLDFSQLRTATGAIHFPVLKPIQISIARFELDPPSPESSDFTIPVLPKLPPVPSIHALVTANLPDILPDPTALTPQQQPPTIKSFFPNPAPLIKEDEGRTDGRTALNDVGTILYIMNVTYDEFWGSLRLEPEKVEDGTEEDCVTLNSLPCIHAEMDLLERFTRMCARPGVLLQEDFGSRGRPINRSETDFDVCPREDWACQQLNQETYGTQKGWGIHLPDETTQQALLSELRQKMFKETVLQEGVSVEDRIRFFVNPSEIIPSFEVRGGEVLIPTSPFSPAPSPTGEDCEGTECDQGVAPTGDCEGEECGGDACEGEECGGGSSQGGGGGGGGTSGGG